MSEAMTIRVDRKTKSRLEKLAKAMDRTKSYVAAEAIRAYIDLNEWQIAEIRAALKEAEARDFASGEEGRAVMKKWRGVSPLSPAGQRGSRAIPPGLLGGRKRSV